MNPAKKANIIYPVNEFSLNRWSPRAFSDQPVSGEAVRSILEAARWAPSASNQQPWRFLVGLRPDETWKKIFETLDDWNKRWAVTVPVLILVISEKAYSRDKKEVKNPYYAYDAGQAAAHLTVEAASRGLHVHQMGGFDAEVSSRIFEIPGDFQPLTAIALGYGGDASALPEDLREKELSARTRKGFDEFVFSEKFGQKSTLFYEE